jgi:cytochrome c-type biogenesis protein CcmH
MLLWAVLTIIAVVTAAAATIPLVRRYEAQATPKQAVLAVLGDQLRDVDAQQQSGTIAAPEAEALRLEIKRRMLSTGREVEARVRPLGTGALGGLAIGLAAVVGVAATALYATLGRPDLAVTAPAPAPPAPAAATGAPDIASIVGQLEARMKRTPNEPEGWRMLGWSYFQTSRFKDSAEAYRKALALAPKAPGYASAYGEALVQAANGIVTPTAVEAFTDAQALDPADARAGYFLGLGKQQAGDRKGAIDEWIALLGRAPAGAPWAAELRRVIGEAAQAAGIDVSARLAAIVPPAAAPVTAAPNPSDEQVAAVKAMPAGDQQAMIHRMVDGLADKLKANPNDPQGWVRLMRARLVLGDKVAAATARRQALAALQGDPAGTTQINEAAASLGIAAK